MEIYWSVGGFLYGTVEYLSCDFYKREGVHIR